MHNLRSLFFSRVASALAISAVALSAEEAPKPPPLKAPITSLKDLHRETPFVVNGASSVVIVAGPDAGDLAQAGRIREALKAATGAEFAIQESADPEGLLKSTHVIAVGNMATNPFLEKLYRCYYTYVDRWYPGKGGHVLRSVHNPFGGGHNVIVVGASDADGLSKAGDAFLAKVQPGKPPALNWTMEIQLGEGMVPPKPGEYVAAWSEFERKKSYFGWNPISKDFALYYMTGDTAYIDDVRKLLFPKGDKTDPRLFNGDRMFEDLRRPLREAYHYQCHQTTLIWDLVEESPAFTDDERLFITNELRLQQDHLSMGCCNRFMTCGTLPDRHQIYEILNVWSGSRYFAYSYPNPVWGERMQACRKAFDLNLKTAASNTPRIQTGTVIWPLQEFALYSGEDAYFKPGGVFSERINKWLFQGTEVVGQQWNHTMLRSAAHLFNDGAFLTTAGALPSTFRVGQAYATDVAPAPPKAMVGLRAFRLHEPCHRKVQMAAPVEQACESVIYRSSMSKADKQHVMLYGYYEKSKSPPRVNSVLSYIQNGVRLLRINAKNEPCVLRGGLREHGPSHGVALKACSEMGQLGYVQTQVPDHDFCTWDRSLFILKDRALVVFDGVRLRDSGDYEATLPWQVNTNPEAVSQGGRWRQNGRRFAVIGTGSNAECDGRTVRFAQRNTFEGGQTIGFQTLLTSVPETAREPRIAALSETVIVLDADGYALLGRGDLAGSDVAANAQAFMVSPWQWAMVAGTRLEGFGISLTATAPADVSWAPETGKLTVQAGDTPVTVTLSGPVSGTVTCAAGEHGDVAVAGTCPELDTVIGSVAEKAFAADSSRRTQATADSAVAKTALPSLGTQCRFRVKGSVTALHVLPDGRVLAASDKGHVVCLENEEKLLWSFQAQGPVYALAAGKIGGDEVCFIGSDDEHLYAINADGTLRWKTKARVSEWMAHHHHYWTMGNKAKVREILVADVEGDGGTDIFIGTGGSAVERLDEKGVSQWLFTFLYGTPSSLVLADASPKSPGLELVVGAFDSCYNSVVRIVDPATGKEKKAFTTPYPKGTKNLAQTCPDTFRQGNAFMHRLALGDGRQGVLRVLCGPSWNQLSVNELPSGAGLWCRDLGSGGGSRKFGEFTSGCVLTELNSDGTQDAVIGMRSGWVCAFSGRDGKALWSTRLDRPVRCFAGTPGSGAFLAGCEGGEWVQIDAAGKPVAKRVFDGLPRLCAALPGETLRWVVGDTEGWIRILAPGTEDVTSTRSLATWPFPFQAAAGDAEFAPMPFVAFGDDPFLGALNGSAASWRLRLPDEAKAELEGERSLRISSGTTVCAVRVLSPMGAIAAVDGKEIQITAAAPGPLVLRGDTGALPTGYQQRVPPADRRWKSLCTNGAEFVIFQNEAVYFKPKTPGDWCEFEVTASAAGETELWAEFYCSTHRGICDVFLDGVLLLENLDLYRAERVFWTEPLLLGKRNIKAGTHKVRLVLKGKRPEAQDQVLSIRSAVLLPTTWRRTDNVTIQVTDSGLCVDWEEAGTRRTALFKKPSSPTAEALGVRTDAGSCAVVRVPSGRTNCELRNGTKLVVDGQTVLQLPEGGSARTLPEE